MIDELYVFLLMRDFSIILVFDRVEVIVILVLWLILSESGLFLIFIKYYC